jgi:hypothetical protein
MPGGAEVLEKNSGFFIRRDFAFPHRLNNPTLLTVSKIQLSNGKQ